MNLYIFRILKIMISGRYIKNFFNFFIKGDVDTNDSNVNDDDFIKVLYMISQNISLKIIIVHPSLLWDF